MNWYLQVFQDLLKLPINDLTGVYVTVQRLQLLIGQPVRRPLGVIQTVPELGLHHSWTCWVRDVGQSYMAGQCMHIVMYVCTRP